MDALHQAIHAGRVNCLIPIYLLSALIVAGCGGGGSGGPAAGPSGATPNSQLLAGQVFKGPLNDSFVEILGPGGALLATGTVNDGRFELSANLSTHAYIEIRTRGGYFMDEATGARVDVPSAAGLHAMFAVADLETQSGHLVLSPETTIVTGMMRHLMQSGGAFDTAMNQSTGIVAQQFIDDSRPPGVPVDADVVTHFGTPLSPVAAQDALAWHRARAFSQYAHDLGLGVEAMFQLMDALALDMRDALLDGLAGGEPITIPGAGGMPFHMATHDHALYFSRARAGILQHDLQMVVAGNAAADFRHHLELMSLDLAPFDLLHEQYAQGIATTAQNLAADNLAQFQHLPVLPDEDGDSGNQEGHYTLRAMPDVDVTIRAPGTSWATPMYRYNGLQLPPVIRARRGEEMFLTLVNELAEATTIHWHGFKVPGPEDGGPNDPVSPNATRPYHFDLDQPAASLWFHPHPHGRTAEQVYRGLAGVMLLSDDVEDQLRLTNSVPALEHDIPILIQDRLFGADVSGVRQLIYSGDHMSGFGMMGGVMLVNGVELPRLDVETRQYTLRLYNASNSRTYEFALHDGRSFHIVGSDGGWLPQTVQADHIVLSAGERAAIVIDFATDQPGDRLMLVSRPFMGGAAMGMTQFHSPEEQSGVVDGMGGHMGGGHHSGEPYLPGAGADIMRFDVASVAADDVQLYDRLPAGAEISTRLTAQDATAERSFVMSWSHVPGRFLINGKEYAADRVDEHVESGATEIWQIINISPVPHPFHAHAIQWQVLDRNGAKPLGVERGWKDTVLVRPGENVRIIGRFEPVNYGEYVYHCHILEHEDAGMMGQFFVGP